MSQWSLNSCNTDVDQVTYSRKLLLGPASCTLLCYTPFVYRNSAHVLSCGGNQSQEVLEVDNSLSLVCFFFINPPLTSQKKSQLLSTEDASLPALSLHNQTQPCGNILSNPSLSGSGFPRGDKPETGYGALASQPTPLKRLAEQSHLSPLPTPLSLPLSPPEARDSAGAYEWTRP